VPPACIGSSFGMSSRLTKSVCSGWLTNQGRFLIDVADTRLPNEMRAIAPDIKRSTVWRFRV
jgi:hypothetical protein